MRAMVELRLDGWIKWKFAGKSPELCRMLIQHERKRTVVDNLCSQITTLELKKPDLATTKNVADIIDNVAGNFCRTALGHWEQETRSDLENRRLQTEANKEKELEEYAKENFKEVDEKVTEV